MSLRGEWGIWGSVVMILMLLMPLGQTAEASPDGDWEWLRADQVEWMACPFRDEIDFEHGEIECGLVEVPENREASDSRSIELHVVRIAGRDSDERRDDPVVYLTGGPGVPADFYVSRLKDHPILDRRDLYVVEQRGIAHSGDYCPLFSERLPELSARDNFLEASESLMARADHCLRQARARGVDVRGYNTIENARDIRAIRMALGYEDWNVWGISYGAMLGQAMLRWDPDGIRAMVIDAIVPLDVEDMGRIGSWYQRDLDKLFEACGDQRACRRAHEELEERYFSAIAQLSESPLSISVPKSPYYPDGEAWVFQNSITGLPFGLLYEQSNHPILPALIDRMTRAVEEEDKAFFTALAVADTSGGAGSSTGMSMAVRCQDGYIHNQVELLEEELERNPLLTPAFGHPDVMARGGEACEAAGVSPRDPAGYQIPDSELPVVVINGAWDPITPPPLARYVAEQLGNARYVEFPHAGHGPTRSVSCAGDFMNDFFDDPEADLDQDCVQDGEEAAQYLGRVYETDAITRGLLMSETEAERLPTQIAWAGTGLLLAGGGFLGMGFAWLSRRISRAPRLQGGGGRCLVFLSSALILAWLVGMGLAAWRSAELSEALLLVGFLPWAAWVAWLAPLALLLALAGLWQVFKLRGRYALSSLLGLMLTVIGVVLLALFGLVWDLWPF